MVRNTSLTKQEAVTVIYLFESIPRLLELGFTVQLGRVGYFMVTISRKDSDTEKGGDSRRNESNLIVLHSSADIRDEINKYPIEKLDL